MTIQGGCLQQASALFAPAMYPLIHKTLPNGTSVSYAWFEAMHSRMDILICGIDEWNAGRLAFLLSQETERLADLMNRFDPGSLLSQINTAPPGTPVSISRELATILSTCREWYRRTQGLFDNTIQSPASESSLMDAWEITPEDTVIRHHPGIVLDLCGFAKGYAVDSCKSVLLREGVRDALVNFGNSSVLAIGNHPHGKGWPVGLGVDEAQIEGEYKEFTLHNQCLTTSGNNTTGRQHLIRPDSRQVVTGKKLVSVVTETGTVGEILSTVFFIAEKEEKEYLADLDVLC